MDEWPDDLLAVMAHGLLHSMGVIAGAAETMKLHWGRLDDAIKLELLDKMIAQAALVTGVLGDLVRSGQPELVDALDHLTDDEG
jgi:hypothetical protein